MRGENASVPDWRNTAAYAPLMAADRSLFAWEWLRRVPAYRAAAERALSKVGGERREDEAAAHFGLVGFEDPDLAVPDARPLWRASIHPRVLSVERGSSSRPEDAFELDCWSKIAVFVTGEEQEHLLLSDGFRAIRLDAPLGTFAKGPVCLRYKLEGLASAEPKLMTLRQLLVLRRSGRYARSLHPGEPRARRWILILRASDALAAGADQRHIAEALLSVSARAPRWRSSEPSLRARAQRLVRSARAFATGRYLELVAGHARPTTN